MGDARRETMEHVSKRAKTDGEFESEDGDSGTHADGKCKDLADPSGAGCGIHATVFQALPEDIVDMIVARVPFPSLYQARCLSKSWKFAFAPRPAGRLPVSPLQENVALVSWKWPKFCPVYVGEGEILGFDNGSKQWRSMQNLSLHRCRTPYVASRGALIANMVKTPGLARGNMFDVVVTNVLTNRRRMLPKLPVFDLYGLAPTQARYTPRKPDHFKILPLDTDGYRVLVVYKNIFTVNDVHALIYDSKLRTWTVKESTGSSPLMYTRFSNTAYLDEKLYCMFANSNDTGLDLLVYDIGENIWTAIPFDVTERYYTLQGGMLRCGNKIMVAVGAPRSHPEDREYSVGNWIRMYELIPPSLELKYLCTNPANLIWDRNLGYDIDFASDADFVYLGCKSPDFAVVTFDVHTHEWGRLPLADYASRKKKLWVDTPFEPGLNPFQDL